jgi:uncharacterized protein (TIGR02996 family)
MSAATLLSAISESPEDDTPRLVYADWLEENGQAERGEFIRVQCQLARTPRTDPHWVTLRDRAAQLQRQHGKDWQAEVPSLEGGYWGSDYRRGFVEEATFGTWSAFADQARRIFAAAPLVRLHLTKPASRSMAKMARSPLLARLRRLKMYVGEIGEAGVQTLAGSPHLGNLTSLDLSCGGPPPRLGPNCARAVAKSPSLTGLRELVLSAFDLGSAGARALATSPNLAGLTALDLGICGIGVAGARALASSRRLTRLVRLGLDFNPLGCEGVAALAGSPVLAQVEYLGLAGTNLGPQGVRALADSPYLSRLRDLWLGGNTIEVEGVQALAESPRLPELTFLDLSRTGIGDFGATVLAGAAHLGSLERLLLPEADVGRAGAEALLTSPHLPRLTLGFRRQDIPAAGQRDLRRRFGDRVEFDWS